LIDGLVDRLSLSDLQSLLLEVYQSWRLPYSVLYYVSNRSY
jgi:hypothetical protein